MFLEIKQILLQAFSESQNSQICVYGEKNFVALANWDAQLARMNIEQCQVELNKCLLTHSQFNVVDVKMGLCFVLGSIANRVIKCA